MLRAFYKAGAFLIVAPLASGCGTYVPPVAEYFDTKQDSVFLTAGGLMEYNVKAKVYCAIVDAIRFQDALPADWAVQVTLDLQVDEVGALNPGVSFIDPLPSSQSFTMGVGGTASSQSTREDKFSSYWLLSKLNKKYVDVCDSPERPELHGSSPLIEAQLGIKEWLSDALKATYYLPSSTMTTKGDTPFKQDAISYHIKFIIITSGNATPTWKLVRIATGNGNSPLAAAGRTRTHDLLITVGPAFKPNGLNIAWTSHSAQEYGIAISNGNRTIFTPVTTTPAP
ncbi:MAG: hypothetical protein WDO17_12055 [Alphaproteobacteria bacterium]